MPPFALTWAVSTTSGGGLYTDVRLEWRDTINEMRRARGKGPPKKGGFMHARVRVCSRKVYVCARVCVGEVADVDVDASQNHGCSELLKLSQL